MTDYSIFFIIAVVATGVGALLFLLSLFGLGEHDLDFDADSGGADVGLLSIKSGIGFFWASAGAVCSPRVWTGGWPPPWRRLFHRRADVPDYRHLHAFHYEP